MMSFISSQLPDGERIVVLGGNSGRQISALVMAVGDEIEIATNCPEWVTLREVYEYFRWNTMTSWEQHAAIRGADGDSTVPSVSRLEQVAGRMEAYLAAVAQVKDDQPSDAPIQSAGPPRSNQLDEQAMTTREVALLLGCSYTEARERLLDGRIKAIKDGRWLRTRKEWVEEYIARKTVQPAQAEPGVHSVPAPRKRPCQFTLKKGGAGYRFLKKLSEQ
jgi:excisionase family DNA binding protein